MKNSWAWLLGAGLLVGCTVRNSDTNTSSAGAGGADVNNAGGAGGSSGGAGAATTGGAGGDASGQAGTAGNAGEAGAAGTSEAGQGGAGGQSGQGGQGGAALLPASERQKSLFAMLKVLHDIKLSGKTNAEQAADFRAQALSFPHVVGVIDLSEPGADAETVSLVFEDGVPATFLFLQGYFDTTPETVPTPVPQSQLIPKGKEAAIRGIFDGWGEWPKHQNRLVSQLTLAGYNPQPGGLSLQEARAVKAPEIFYLNTHGGEIRLRDSKSITMGLMTSTPVLDGLGNPITDDTLADANKDLNGEFSSDNDPTTASDLATGRLGYMFAAGPDFVERIYYAVTNTGIVDWWDFSATRLAYLDICQSGSNQAVELAMRKSAGAALSVWTWQGNSPGLRAYERAQAVFDRLLGTDIPATGNFPLPSPLQRPFDDEEVYKEIKKYGWDHVLQDKTDRYLLRSGGTDTTLLLPTIEDVHISSVPEPNVGPISDYIDVRGDFLHEGDGGGAVPKVTLDGKELSSCGILKDRVVRCKFTKANPKDVPVGDVVIEVDGRKSNSVPITRWTLPFSWSYQPKSSFQVDVSCVLALRTDVHDRRLHAGDTPERAPARYLEPDGEASSCYYEVSQGNLQGCTNAVGSGTIPYKKTGQNGFTFKAQLDMKRPVDKRLYFSINVDPITQGATASCPDGQGGQVKTTLPIALIPVADDASTATKDPSIGSYVFAFPVSDTFHIGSDAKVTASGAQGEMFHIFSIPETKADAGSTQQESSPNQSTRR